MKASPQLLSLLLKRPKWGSLSDEFPPLPLQTETHTDTRSHAHVDTYVSLAHIFTRLAHTIHKNGPFCTCTHSVRCPHLAYAPCKHMHRQIISKTPTHTHIHTYSVPGGMTGLVGDLGAWHLGMRCLASGPQGGQADCDVRLLGSAQQCLLVCSAGGHEGVHAYDGFY